MATSQTGERALACLTGAVRAHTLPARRQSVRNRIRVYKSRRMPADRPGVVLVIVAALVLDPGHRLVLRRGLRGVADVHFCERIEGLRALVRRSWVHLVITVPTDKAGRQTAATVAEIRQGFPSL